MYPNVSLQVYKSKDLIVSIPLTLYSEPDVTGILWRMWDLLINQCLKILNDQNLRMNVPAGGRMLHKVKQIRTL